MYTSIAYFALMCLASRVRMGYHTNYIDQHALPDRMVRFAGKVAFLFILCHPQRLKIVRRVFTIFGTVLLMRAVSVSVTVLPDASPVCRARLEVRKSRGWINEANGGMQSRVFSQGWRLSSGMGVLDCCLP